ncbi:MAG: flagellar biosynthesis protein FlhB [Rhodobacteraceae bacterium]|nr:flagellar biosynthesis protein FlhB [Paracoccaceae bacterium]|tara:strand:- start:926 stop:2080 length:1155 start_codon:yes stop_codon:yes gene_type:complete
MAEENQDGQEKTEEPSQRKIDKHKEDGKVLSSKEMFVFTGIAGALLLLYALPYGAKSLLFEWGDLFVFSGNDKLDDLPSTKSLQALFFILKISLIVGLPMLIIVLATQFAVGGINFAPKAAAFKSNRINPLSGFKRMFSLKSLVELGKALLKVGLLFASAIGVIYYLLPRILRITDGTLKSGLEITQIAFPMLIGALLVSLLAIAALDYFYQRYEHVKSLRMTKQEVKDEYKQTEGSPEVRAKIRRLQMESAAKSAKQQEALENMGEATAIITNPTHFAIALKYQVGQLGAPKIIAMGKGLIAKRIMDIGTEKNITSFRSPLLARALFFTGDIGEEISEKLYNAVAIALAYVYKLDKGEDIEAPEINVPEDLRFNENGNILKEV